MALLASAGDAWIAGFTLHQNLLHALWLHGAGQIDPLLLPGVSDGSGPLELLFEPEHVLRAPPPRRRSILHRLASRLKPGPEASALEAFLIEKRVDAVLGYALAIRLDRVATLSIVPDFQHVHLPEMFSVEERQARDERFARSAELSTRVILLADPGVRDFRSFMPSAAHKARALFPPPDIPDSVYRADPGALSQGLGLPPKFLYFPGQFWKHKNHQRLFAAVRLANERGARIHVVCTGHPQDYRWPSHGSELLETLSASGIREQVIYLGLLPRADVLGLMRQSAAVINPSLFEGWGMTVDEARSLGKPLLISDIAAHRDQDPPRATYFDPRNVEDIATKLAAVWTRAAPGPDRPAEEAAHAELVARQRAFAAAFRDLVREAVTAKARRRA